MKVMFSTNFFMSHLNLNCILQKNRAFLKLEEDTEYYIQQTYNPYFVGELILPYLMANGIFTVTNFHRTFTNKFQL